MNGALGQQCAELRRSASKSSIGTPVKQRNQQVVTAAKIPWATPTKVTRTKPTAKSGIKAKGKKAISAEARRRSTL